MPRKNLPYVNSYKDRTGKMRYYLRRPGLPQIPLPGRPGSREFMRAYHWTLAPPVKPAKVSLTPRTGQVYYLSDGETVKIGYTKDWDERKKKYKTHSGRDVVLLAIHPGYRADETELHRRFKVYRKRGDWFYPGDPILEHIKKIVDEQSCLTDSDEVTNANLSDCIKTTFEASHL